MRTKSRQLTPVARGNISQFLFSKQQTVNHFACGEIQFISCLHAKNPPASGVNLLFRLLIRKL
jgi:hypothetical protein